MNFRFDDSLGHGTRIIYLAHIGYAVAHGLPTGVMIVLVGTVRHPLREHNAFNTQFRQPPGRGEPGEPASCDENVALFHRNTI